MAEEEKKGVSPIPIIIAVLVAAVVVFFVAMRKEEYRPVVAGTSAPEFTLSDLAGKTVRIKDYRGKVVFLNFWATWCKPCEEEMPGMEALFMALKNKPFEMLAISVDSDTSPIKPFMEKYNITFTVLHDKGGKIKELYKTTGVPETFIIDQNGIIAEKVWGPRDWNRMENLSTIGDLLKNGPKKPEDYLSR